MSISNTDPLFEPLHWDWSSGSVALWYAAGSFAGYSLLHSLIFPLLPPHLPFRDRAYLPGKLASSLNGILCGVAALHLFLYQRPWNHDVIRPYPALLDAVFGSFLGYSLYDLALMARVGDHWTYWLHHGLGVLGTLLMVLLRRGSYFPALFLFSEWTVLPVNVSWVLSRLWPEKMFMNGAKTEGKTKRKVLTRIGLGLLMVRLAMFLTFRTFLGPIAMHRAWLEKDAMKTLHPLLSGPIAFNVVAFTLMNFKWTKDLIRVLILGLQAHRRAMLHAA